MIDIFPTKYMVTGLDMHDDPHGDAQVWSLNLEWRGPGDRWAICHASQCLGSDGRWEYESSPSNRTDDFKARYRFPLKEAKRLATEAYPHLVINGRCVRDGKLVKAIEVGL